MIQNIIGISKSQVYGTCDEKWQIHLRVCTICGEDFGNMNSIHVQCVRKAKRTVVIENRPESQKYSKNKCSCKLKPEKLYKNLRLIKFNPLFLEHF
jgi:hypothetical protein